MTMIQRSTDVISVSLPKKISQKLEKARKRNGQTRSAYIVSLIERLGEEERWSRIFARGEKTAQEFKITSEDDIDRILHEA